eukprot:9771492-Karenia_brevis.AAC.1
MSTVGRPGLQVAGAKQFILPDGAGSKVFSKEGLQPGAAGICFGHRHQFGISHTLRQEAGGLAVLFTGHRDFGLEEKGISKDQAAQ